DGAQWLKTSSYGDSKDWVIVRETGEFTYLLPDIAYHKDRFDKKYDKIIDIWGADHQAHVNKIKAVSRILDYKGELVFLITQVVRLKGEKMSKRKGKVVTLEWLINEAGADAVRFIYLMKSLDTQMEFDVALAKDQSEKNPVYYAQYAHARICSILRKLKNEGLKLKPSAKNLNLLNHPSELTLIKQLIKFSEVIEDTARDYQVQRIPQYALDLAASFHQFYHDCRVISEDVRLSEVRLGLSLAAKIILKSTLSLMGVSAPEKM
ncbi:MAG TPA: arginine--tRNA ligase, partial [Candidatus Paceibacterota bacterium]|nr:arginine--tRNA ligase [Candidatus Paceibacterota bacterium]